MKFTIDQLEAEILLIVEGLATLRKNKGHDYAGDEDTFSDLRPLGVDYCCKRLIQKAFRVLQLLQHPPAVTTDSLEAEFGDIINFALYMPILHRQLSGAECYEEAEEKTGNTPLRGKYSTGYNYCSYHQKWYKPEEEKHHYIEYEQRCVVTTVLKRECGLPSDPGGKVSETYPIPKLGDGAVKPRVLPVGERPVRICDSKQEPDTCDTVQDTSEGTEEESTR